MWLKLFTLFIISISAAHAQKNIKPEEAINHVGDSVKVCGKVFGVVNAGKSEGQPTFINFGAKFPNQTLVAVSFCHVTEKFNYSLHSIDEKNVCVRGKVTLNKKEKPQIVISQVEQLEN